MTSRILKYANNVFITSVYLCFSDFQIYLCVTAFRKKVKTTISQISYCFSVVIK